MQMKKQNNWSVKKIKTALFIYTFAFWFSKELARPAISIALADSDTSSMLVGVLLSLQNFLPLILCIPMSTMGDKKGHESVLNIGSWFTVISGLFFLSSLLGITGNLGSLLLITIGQILSGIAWTVSWISLQALISECDDQYEGKGSSSGINRLILIMSFGMVLGPLISGYLIDGLGRASVWILNMVLCIIQIVISFLMTKISVSGIPKKKETAGITESEKKESLLKQLGGTIYLVMVTFSFVMMFGSEIRSSYMSVLLRDANISSTVIGYVSSIGALSTCLIRVLMNLKFSDKISRMFLIILSMIFSVSAFLSLAVLPVGSLYMIPSILIGLCGGIVEPLLIVYILENSRRERKGLALTGRVLVNRLAMFVAPSVASVLVAALGMKKGFGLLSLFLFLLISVAVYGMKRTMRREKYEKS